MAALKFFLGSDSDEDDENSDSDSDTEVTCCRLCRFNFFDIVFSVGLQFNYEILVAINRAITIFNRGYSRLTAPEQEAQVCGTE